MRATNRCWMLAVLCLLLAACDSGTKVERTVADGVLVGRHHQGVERYLGIPYAQPPIGELRWRAPEPLAGPWQGKRDAGRFASACVQGAKPSLAHGSQEDCLYLNVWTPDDAGERLPVMVWIHGGGFMLGSANEPAYDGEALSRAGKVVVVSMNYRLGFLGFLAVDQAGSSAEADAVPGNQGLLDQVQALRWVHDNIASFGGDPDNVTVFGESGGGVATCLLLASPLTDGLIHRAIMESGTCGIQKTMTPEQAHAQSSTFFSKIGCATQPDPLGCARKLSIDEFHRAGYAPHSLLTMDTSTFSYYPLAVLDDRFLPADPLELLRSPQRKQIPVMIGTNRDEGSLFTGQIDLPTSEAEHRAHLDALLPGNGDRLSALYPFTPDQAIGLAYSAMFGDAMENCPAGRFASLWSQSSPVYRYFFTQTPSAPALWLMTLRNKSGHAPLGVYHGAEIPYVFGNNGLTGHVQNDAQRHARRIVQSYWSNFARNGDPNGIGLPSWAPDTDTAPAVMELSGKPQARGALREAQCAFWDEHASFSFW